MGMGPLGLNTEIQINQKCAIKVFEIFHFFGIFQNVGACFLEFF